MITPERTEKLNGSTIKNRKFLLYWMQSSVRVENNLALAYAISRANGLNKPLVVFFGIARDYPEANLRHYHFLLEGLREAKNALEEIGIKTVVSYESPAKGIVELAKESCLTVVDKGYLKLLKTWYSFAAENMDCPLVQVEDNVVVPVKEASVKEEYSAATLRPKLSEKIHAFLTRVEKTSPKRDA